MARSSGPTLFAIRRKAAGKASAESLMEQIDAAKLPHYETEFRFCDRMWRFDLAFVFFRIAVEIEGGAHGRLIVIERGFEHRQGGRIAIKPGTRIRMGGRHQTGPGFENDMQKYNEAAVRGWTVLRFSTRQIRDGEAIKTIRAALVAKGLE